MQCNCGGNTQDRQKTIEGEKFTYLECGSCKRVLIPSDLEEAIKQEELQKHNP